ncbi:hypothetical protein PAXRUDRAFT_832621 [Paxillus rubicundulus Ve08.2h10]|uniref:Secreted protein n=1 Tax=Paxillus rubicundulus Ve08.2h10 TaxID=930991 RepID=A0A0D0CGB1_9AGAM|nr:hypothetical protein PAXRUDRAFT_832621 [Paxillus rubicundulus Ve08.2h10]
MFHLFQLGFVFVFSTIVANRARRYSIKPYCRTATRSANLRGVAPFYMATQVPSCRFSRALKQGFYRRQLALDISATSAHVRRSLSPLHIPSQNNSVQSKECSKVTLSGPLV